MTEAFKFKKKKTKAKETQQLQPALAGYSKLKIVRLSLAITS